MIGVDALVDLAKMVDLVPQWKRPLMYDEARDMGANHSLRLALDTFGQDAAIAVVALHCGPYPATTIVNFVFAS
jgi:hypothetical protein